MLRAFKRGSYGLSKRFGVTNWIGRTAWRRSRLLILCYHGISLDDEHRWAPLLFMSPRRFERRLQLLQRHGCTVLPLAEAVERTKHRDLPERAVVLTFDDGYYNFVARAASAVRAFGFPATVYLTTLRCEHNFPIVNLLVSYGLWLHRSETLCARSLPGLPDGEYPLATRAQRDHISAAIRDEGVRNRLSFSDKDALARAVFDSFGGDYDWFVRNRRLTLLRPDEVSTLSAAGVDFQMHTHTHTTPTDLEAFALELRDNAASLEAMTGSPRRHFCYPSGVYRMSYLPVLQAEGIETATTCEPGLVTPQSHPLLLPRFIDNQHVSETEFEAWLTGAAAGVPALRSRGRAAAERIRRLRAPSR
jgi:peptidoglycan/xylan/chitin deacetylase (PgdA/CDA1 family)